jgi:hypothetical protein
MFQTYIRMPWLTRRTASMVAAICILFAVGADAQPRRARMSRDLAERLQARRGDAARVIVEGDAARVQALARRHGGRVTKVLSGAAVVEFRDDSLDAVSRDPEVDHLSGDVPVHRLADVTAESIGADQVWDGGIAGPRGYTGGDRLGDSPPCALQPAGHQPVARAPGVRELS